MAHPSVRSVPRGEGKSRGGVLVLLVEERVDDVSGRVPQERRERQRSLDPNELPGRSHRGRPAGRTGLPESASATCESTSASEAANPARRDVIRPFLTARSPADDREDAVPR